MAGLRTRAELAVATMLLVGCGDLSEPGWRIAADPRTPAPAICVGGEVPEQAGSVEPSGPELPPDGGGSQGVGPAVGSPAPTWALTDFQPQSCGYGATYGLEAFHGRVTVVALWSGS